MAKVLIASAIDLNTTLQDSLLCSIHQGLLTRPMILPCKGKHRLCQECLKTLIGTTNRITCPECRESYPVPLTWNDDWYDRVLDGITSQLSSSEQEINQKVIQFVQESYSSFVKPDHHLHIESVQLVSNPRLKEAFDRRKTTIGRCQVVTLLHGTTRSAALSISGTGFRIPQTFDRNPDNSSEGELKFGKAIYFAHAKKATEYGKNILVLADCIIGRVQEKDVSELKLTPEIMRQRGYDTIHYFNRNEGAINQEWAIYEPSQCYPLCIIQYELLDNTRVSEQALINKVNSMNHMNLDWATIHQSLLGTDNQCKAALRFLGDAHSRNSSSATSLMNLFLRSLCREQLNGLLTHTNETIRILFLRALWQIGRRDQNLQYSIYQSISWSLLLDSLYSGYADVSWRSCGVITNIAAVVTDVRRSLTSTSILNQLLALLKRAVQSVDKICTLTVLNLLSNIAATEHNVVKRRKDILNYVNDHLLDHPDTEIEEAGNRLFCNIIGKGFVTPDWRRGGFSDTAMAPNMQ